MIWFDRLFYTLVVLIGVNAALRWRVVLDKLRYAPAQAENGNSEAIAIGAVAVFFCLLISVWWLASRRRSKIAITLLAVMYLGFAIVGAYNFATQTYSWTLTMWSSAAQIIVYIASLITLALPASRHWFSRSVQPKDLKEMFS